jgi:mono/diheme cytochrome c family protein
MRIFLLVGLVCLLAACGKKQAAPESGAPTARPARSVYEQYCTRCHGVNGREGIGGAANLAESRLEVAQIRQVVANGKGAMPSFSAMLSSAEADSLAQFVKYLQH